MPKKSSTDVYRMSKAKFLLLWVSELDNPTPTIRSLAESCTAHFVGDNEECLSKHGQPTQESMEKRVYGKCRSLVLAMRRDIGKELPIPSNSKKPSKSIAELIEEAGGTSFLK